MDGENSSDMFAYEGLLTWLQANHDPMKKSLGSQKNNFHGRMKVPERRKIFVKLKKV